MTWQQPSSESTILSVSSGQCGVRDWFEMVDLVHAPVRNLENIVENAARGLVRTNHRSAESFVSVPLFYPSGSGTTLSVTLERNGLRVSDLSAAYQEVKMVGAETGFTRKASRVSERLGLELLAHSVTALLSEANLASAISDVASASTEIANYLVERTAGREEAEISAHLLEKLRNIFGQSRIIRPVSCVDRCIGSGCD